MHSGWVYVLKLKHGRWYIGHTPREDYLPALADEVAGFGSPFTVLHPVVEVDAVYRGDYWVAEEVRNLFLRFLGPIAVRAKHHEKLFQDRRPRGFRGTRLGGHDFGQAMKAYASVIEDPIPAEEISKLSPTSLEVDLAAKVITPARFSELKAQRERQRKKVDKAIHLHVELSDLDKREAEREKRQRD